MPDFSDDFDRIRSFPLWDGPIEIRPLDGGITNKNFVVHRRAGGSVVVRLADDIPDHGILRFNEVAAARAAFAAGLSPEVIAAGPGFLVTRFLNGRPLTSEEVRAPANLPRIVDLLRRCHTDIPKHFRGPALIFWVFQVIRSYAGLLVDDGSRLAPELPRLLAVTEELERTVGPVEIVFGHNDLLPGNLFDDGERLWLLDWDYAGFNTGLFDLANLASNNGFSARDEADLLALYAGAPPSPARLRAFEAMKCASLLREALWSAVSESRSTIDFDYVAYTDGLVAQFETALTAFRG